MIMKFKIRKKGECSMQLITTPFKLEDIETMAQAGANAFLFGTPFFSMRAVAEYRMEQLQEIRERTKQTNTEMLILVNRFFTEEELPKLRQHLTHLKEQDVDGIIFSDDALLAYAKELGMEHLLIYQPDTLLTNHMDIDFYLHQGIKRAVLSKEITIEEIQSIANKSDPSRLELIIHGRLLMMHSKRKLLSNYMEFTKQNRSLTNEKDLYIVEDTRNDRMPILEDEHGTHIFSGFVQCAFKEIERLKHLKINALRIDGIFQNSAYFTNIIRLYHQCIQGAITGEQAEIMFQELYPHEPISSGFYYQRTSKTK